MIAMVVALVWIAVCAALVRVILDNERVLDEMRSAKRQREAYLEERRRAALERAAQERVA